MQKLKYEQIPDDVLKEINDANIEDILDRYNDEVYHNPQIALEVLREHDIILVNNEGEQVTY